MAIAYIGLGSNLGDRERNLREALALLHDPPTVIRQASSRFHQTAPVDSPPDSPSYLNAAAVLETTLGPEELLNRLLAIEAELGRERPAGVVNAPRTIDLDLLMYDNVQMHTPKLWLPHPRLHERKFVLGPLSEIAPDVRHPEMGKTISTLLNDLESGPGR